MSLFEQQTHSASAGRYRGDDANSRWVKPKKNDGLTPHHSPQAISRSPTELGHVGKAAIIRDIAHAACLKSQLQILSTIDERDIRATMLEFRVQRRLTRRKGEC